ncbi:hypothetical protein LMG7143_01654 [Ralstonia thomasii]|jgi:hypothetical protein|uniref:Uncharacterized protein n=1 Tax=Ralstonia thomasii TaxID=3058596 RepID=A0ABN9IXZ9_9RALS|nr:hypothetical protein LMG7143_01654 [Ralstonia sp. LMG 18095]CAJ0792115.1 hypothetical protein LMG18095_02268 [Ralstonia sp. LMG 18095]
MKALDWISTFCFTVGMLAATYLVIEFSRAI